MAFADPQSITISGSTISLPRTSSGTASGAFSSSDQLTKMSVSHSTGKNGRSRHLLRLDVAKIAADPLTAGVNVRATMDAYLVVEVPPTGYTVAEAKAAVDGLVAYLTASTGAKITQLLGGES